MGYPLSSTTSSAVHNPSSGTVHKCPKQARTIPVTGANSMPGSRRSRPVSSTWKRSAGQRASSARAPEAGRALSRQPISARVQGLPVSMHRHGRHDLRENAHAATGLVGSRVVHHESEARRQRLGASARAGSRQLSDRVDDAASIPARHDTQWS